MRLNVRAASTAIIALALHSSLTAQAPVRVWTAKIDTVGRAQRITSPGYTRWRDTTTGWKMTFVKEFPLQGAVPGRFDQNWQVLLLEDGGFVVSHRNPAGIDVYDAEGKFVRSIGSEGPGDGQYSSASSLLMAHDTLVVGDGRRGRVMYFTLQGKSLGGFFVDVHAEPLPLSLDPAGLIRVRQNIGDMFSEHFKWIYFTKRGQRADSVTSPIEFQQRAVPIAGASGSRQVRILMPFQPSQGAAFLRDGTLVYGLGNKYELINSRTGLDTLRVIARSGMPAQPFPKAFADTVIADLVRSPPPGVVLNLTAKDFPEVFPVWNDIAVDDKGFLWVSIGYWQRQTHYFEVFSPDGYYLGPVISRFEYLRGASWNNGRIAITSYDRNRSAVVRTFRIDRPAASMAATPPQSQVAPPPPPMAPPVGRITTSPATSFSWGDTRNVCALYDAALRYVRPDSVRKVVIADSNSMGTPQFAFHAWTSLSPPKQGSGMPWSDSTIRMMNAANFPRADLPLCVRQRPEVITASYAQLMAPFKDREKGWDLFGAAFPGSAGFLVFSRPMWLTEARDEALVYVAQASHWLAGGGQVLYMRRANGVWMVVQSHDHWVS